MCSGSFCCKDDSECPPLRSGHRQRKIYFDFWDSGTPAGVPLSHFHGRGLGETAFAAPLSAKARRCGGGLLVTLAGSPSQSNPLDLPAPPKWEPLAVHANFISLPRPLPLGEVDANAVSRRRGRGGCPCAISFLSPLLQFVQLRQLFVKKFHLRGGENRRRERGRAAFESEEFFIGNTEKSSCKLTTKGV